MTKLTEWLFGGIIFLGLWVALITDNTPIKMTEELQIWAYMVPFIVLASFGAVSLGIIAYRVATFNNCDEAYRELVKEIEEAKRDLASKGFKTD